MPLSQNLKERINLVVSKCETPQAALLPVLHEVQNELGWLPQEAVEEVAEILGLSPASVQSVTTFYTMFFTKPVGKYVMWVCRTLPCALMGAEHVIEYISQKLGIEHGETTPDGEFTLLEAECLAACGSSPVMLVGEELYVNLTRKKLDEIIEKLRKG